LSPSNDNLPIQYVYVISTVRDGEHVAPIKIGQTRSIKSRIRALQTGSPYELEVTFAFPLQGYDMADVIEEACHTVAKADRMKGEWFNIHPNKGLQLVASAINATMLIHGREGDVLAQDWLTLGVVGAFEEAQRRWPHLIDKLEVN
jgi:hypothetical protein